MQDWGKPRRPGRERSRPPPRDPRADSDAPPSSASIEEAPLLSRAPSSRPRTDPAVRIASLQADLERFKSERANDADQVAQMLVRLAGAERAREAAEQRATAADQKATALSAEIERLKARCSQLEAEAWDPAGGSARDAHARLEAVRDAVARVTAMIDELDRREEMAAGIRVRTVEQVRQALAEIEAPPSPPLQPSPVIDVQPLKPMRQRMAEPDPFPTE